MSRTLHIFKKDILHLRWMILGSLGLTVMFVLTEISAWPPGQWPDQSYHRSLGNTLLPAAWFVLIASVVHQEALVSDNHFWLGRPYTWKSLLAAKGLFIAVFINLPLVLAHFVILAGLGFDPVSCMKGLLWKQLTSTVLLLLPAFAIAAVSSAFREFAIAALGFATYLIFLRLFALELRNPPATEWMLELLVGLLMLAAAVIVLLSQYSKRNTIRSRGILVVAGVLTIVSCLPAFWRAVDRFANSGLRDSGDPSIQLAFAPDARRTSGQSSAYSRLQKPDKVEVDLPITVNGLPNSMDLDVDQLDASIKGSSGEAWLYSGDPREQHDGLAAFVRQDERGFLAMLQVDQSFFEEVKSESAELRLSLDVTLFRKDGPSSTRNDAQARVPGGVLCSAIGGHIVCLSPLRRPSRIVLRAVAAADHTNSRADFGYEYHFASTDGDWYSPFPAEFGLSPITLFAVESPRPGSNILVVPEWAVESPRPGSNILVVPEWKVAHFRSVLQIEDLRLADYAAR